MSARSVTLRGDDDTIVSQAVDLATDAAEQIRGEERHQFLTAVRADVGDDAIGYRLQNAASNELTYAMMAAARVGFFLGLTLVSHGPLGDRAWLAEALRLAGEDVAVEVRQAEA